MFAENVLEKNRDISSNTIYMFALACKKFDGGADQKNPKRCDIHSRLGTKKSPVNSNKFC